MEPWVCVFSGNKTEILAAIAHNEGLPQEIKNAVSSLMAVHPELPDFYDKEPREIAEEEILKDPGAYTAAAMLHLPKLRSEYLVWSWKLTTHGDPDHNVSCAVMLDAVLTRK